MAGVVGSIPMKILALCLIVVGCSARSESDDLTACDGGLQPTQRLPSGVCDVVYTTVSDVVTMVCDSGEIWDYRQDLERWVCREGCG